MQKKKQKALKMQSREEIKLKEEREKKHKYVNVLNRKNC
jgi:hypothetical protein